MNPGENAGVTRLPLRSDQPPVKSHEIATPADIAANRASLSAGPGSGTFHDVVTAANIGIARAPLSGDLIAGTFHNVVIPAKAGIHFAFPSAVEIGTECRRCGNGPRSRPTAIPSGGGGALSAGGAP